MMYVAKSQTTAAAAKFIKQIDCWIMELSGQNLHQNLLKLENQIQKSIRTHDKTSSCQPSPCSPIGAMHPDIYIYIYITTSYKLKISTLNFPKMKT
jgi:hypothetical protein